jgi:hypothetical protein
MGPPSRIIDPDRFLLLATLVDWTEVQRRTPKAEPASLIVERRRLRGPRVLQLRWVTDPKLGYPSEPFRVWRRPSMPIEGEKKVVPTPMDFFGAWTGYALPAPAVFVRVVLNVVGASASVLAFSGAPFGSAIVGMGEVPTGVRTISFSAGRIMSLLVFGSATLIEVTMLDGKAADPAAGWQLVELVGLPVDPAVWAGVRDLDQKQGPAPSAMDPREAALDRYRRGAPFYGWQAEIAAGRPAPPWVLADPKAILKAYDSDLLPDLRTIISRLPPDQQHTLTRAASLPLEGTGPDPAQTTYAPLRHLTFAAATDPLASLIGGFGTAYEDEDLPPIVLGDRVLFGDQTRSDWDWMVTALYARGLDDASEAVEYAAIARAPALALPPPAPYGLQARTDGMRASAATDQPWRPVVRLGWDKLPDALPFRAASYAAARAVNPLGSPSTPLMGKRRFDDAALQPISATTSAEEGMQAGRLNALDEALALPAAPSPFPMVHGIAHQDIFGLWSAWAAAAHQVAEPPVKPVPILSVRLEAASPPGANPIAARLVIDFAWDWGARSPKEFRFVARLYPQANPGDGPPVPTVPTGLQKSLGGPFGVPFVVRFNGGDAGAPDAGGTLGYVALHLPGRPVQNAPVVVAGATTRQYRLTIEGFSLDFDAAPRIGLALFAMVQENRAPQRLGPWSGRPGIASAADPRPPVITVVREDVALASLPDASGLHHAMLEWTAFPGAVGYNVYTVAESKLRADLGLFEAPQNETLSQRLAALRAAFRSNPLRAPFARLNDRPVADVRMPVVLPRGTREIHLYAVLGVGAGNVETAWPDLSDPLREKRLFAFAAPQIVAPAPPRLEVRRVPEGDGFRALVALRAAPGPTVARMALYRTRVSEASLSLATMGPHILTFPGAPPSWIVQAVAEPGAPPQPLGRIEGRDAPAGSWKRVFYRAVAEADDDPARGLYGGWSQASGAQEVIVPPAGPPDLAPLNAAVGGGGLAVTVTTTTIAPVEATLLGPHRLRLEAHRVGPDGLLTPLFAWPAPVAPPAAPDDRLEAVPTAAPPPGSQGVHRATAADGTTTLTLALQRPAASDPLQVRVLLTDPLGRARERVLAVPALVIPPPDIGGLVVTKVPGKGFVLAFVTPAPAQTTELGDYVLTLSWRVRPPVGLPPLNRVVRTATLTVPLPAIPLARRNEDLFADLAAIPVRRRGASPPPGTEVIFAVHGAAGTLGIRLEAPDGRVQTMARGLR